MCTEYRVRLQDKVIDLEVANETPSPTVDPSVHVVLCGHSMGGIVAAETLLSIAMDEPISASSTTAHQTVNATTATNKPQTEPVKLATSEDEEPQKSTPPPEPNTLLFPFIHAVLNFDSPMLGISPGVLAHGAEMQINHATTAYKAYDTASSFFGWKAQPGATTPPIPNASTAKAATSNSLWQKWGNYAVVGGAAAAVAGIAGAAYLNWNQINQGLAWAGSHLEFVGCLARGAELQERVEGVVRLTRDRQVGFANFYGVLGKKVTGQTKYAGAVMGEDRTFCVVPRNTKDATNPTGAKRNASGTPEQQQPPPKRPMRSGDAGSDADVAEGQKVQDFARDPTKSKGHWVPCVNNHASDEIVAHTTMFSPESNPDYYDMVTRARDQLAEWVNGQWYADATPHETHQYEHEDLNEPVD